MKTIRRKEMLQKLSDIFNEFLLLKKGQSKYQCRIRNQLLAFCGKMEINTINVTYERERLVELLDQGVTQSNWEEIDDTILLLYKKTFMYFE